MNRLKYFSFILWIFIGKLSAQNYPSLNKYWEPITNAINSENFYEADYLISQALTYQQMQDTLSYLGGKAAFKLNAYGKSEMLLRKLMKTDFESRHQDINFILAEILFNTGRYGEASNLYKAYMPNLDPESTEHHLVENRINQVAWAKENNNNKDPLVKIKRIETGINTPENESSPFLFKDQLYYSGLRKKQTNKFSNVKDFSTYIFKVNENDGKALNLDEGLLQENSSMSGPSFSNDHERFVFSVCNPIENSTKLQCKVYLKTFEKGKWSSAKLLPEQVNQSNFSSTHASIIEDSENGLYRIYYASDRPQGKGGFDIWTVLLNEDGSCSSPENLEYINTIGDEYSPFYSSKSKSLFFSSNYYNGFGGFDIFKYSFKGKDSMKVVNLGRSVNSSFDEITYFTNNDERISYLASNRPGSTYLDETLQACCYDLYKISSTPRSVDLVITIRDAYDSLEIPGAKVRLIDVTETDTLLQTSSMADKSIHNFKLIEDRKYKIVADKLNFLSDSLLVNTLNLYNLDPIKRIIYLVQKKDLIVTTYEKTTNYNLKGVTVSLWDVDKDVLVDKTTMSDTNQFNFNLLKGKNYRLIAFKQKYESDTVNITAMQTSKENPVVRKMFLELSAIAELRRLLPIRMFFDNDIPNPRSEDDTTNVLFSKIYNDYVAKKGIYMFQFADKLVGASKKKAMNEIDTFFDKEIKFNGDKFLLFLDKLSIIMEEGHSIDIFLKGYASPRAKSEYNQHLSSRRVVSIRNEFDYFQSGVFHPYIQNQSLKIKQIPFGESQSSSDVSDSLEDTRNSIYNLKAAFERRVEILEILKGVDDVQSK